MFTRSHRICSIAIVEAGLLFTNQLHQNIGANIILLLATAVGASLPDIDEYNSTVSRKSVINFSLLLRHRGITHSLLGLLVFLILSYWLMDLILPIKLVKLFPQNRWSYLWLGLGLGYFLHLIEDSFSKQGVDWFLPFCKRSGKKHIYYKVGGFFEKTLTFIAYIGIIIMSLYGLEQYF